MVDTEYNCWLAVSSIKHPVNTMVLGVIISYGDVMFPFIFPPSLRTNREAYIKCPEKVMLLGSRG